MAKLVAIKPKSPIINRAEFQKEYIAAFTETTKGMKADFEKTTKTWTRRVKFKTGKPQSDGPHFVAFVGTDDVIYGYVDLGTKRHNIRAKNGGMLRFRTGGISKTVPRNIDSRRGSAATGSFVSKRMVRHPGTAARRFSVIIQLKWQDAFERRMKTAMEKAAKSIKS